MIMIFVENLVLQGIHGATQKEMGARQPFRIDIEAECDDLCAETDSIKKTADYRLMKRAAEKIVQEETHVLLETIAFRIASSIKADCHVQKVRVKIRKLAIWSNGLPGVQVEL